MPAVRDARGVSKDSGSIAPVNPALPALGRDRGNFFTRAAADATVYGEVVRRDAAGTPWRRWDPQRSKVAAALEAGGVTPPWVELLKAAPMLYLGAASGTTVSHIADLAAPAPVVAVERSSRSFQELLVKLRPWANVLPILADAHRPESYAGMVGRAQSIVQDIAQPDQVEILAANCAAHLAKGAPALLFLKARSVDSSAAPDRVYREARSQLEAKGFSVVDERRLEPFDRDHRALLLRWRA